MRSPPNGRPRNSTPVARDKNASALGGPNFDASHTMSDGRRLNGAGTAMPVTKKLPPAATDLTGKYDSQPHLMLARHICQTQADVSQLTSNAGGRMPLTAKSWRPMLHVVNCFGGLPVERLRVSVEPKGPAGKVRSNRTLDRCDRRRDRKTMMPGWRKRRGGDDGLSKPKFGHAVARCGQDPFAALSLAPSRADRPFDRPLRRATGMSALGAARMRLLRRVKRFRFDNRRRAEGSPPGHDRFRSLA